MIRKSLILALLLIFSGLPAESATVPKSGSICTKNGLTINYKGKKYTCIKSGKKLIWDKGVTLKKIPITAATKSEESNQSKTEPEKNFELESTDSYVTMQRYRGNSGWASSLGSNAAVVWNEDPNPSSKSFRVKINSPKSDGISFDSGVIKDYAQNISLFVEGTICYVIYSSDFITYSDEEGKQINSQYRNAEAPRAESGDCPSDAFSGNPIKPLPITLATSGVQIIYSDLLPDNSLKLRGQGASFKSYQVSLESLLNSDVLWSSPIKESSNNLISENITNLNCDTRYSLRIKMWSGPSGGGKLITDVRRHPFTSLPCQIPKVLPAQNANEGSDCIQVGKHVTLSTGYLECRRIAGNKNIWILVNENSKVNKYAGPSEAIDQCKLKDKRPTLVLQNLNHSFPRPDRFKPSTGTVNIAVVGIDFSDARGVGNPLDQDPYLQENFNNWSTFYSGGKLKWNWHVINDWTRVPGLSTQYNQKYSSTADLQMANEVFTALDSKLPLKDIPIVLVIFPPQLIGTNNGYMPFKSVPTEISTGTYAPYYWGGDPSDHQYLSTYYYHEVLHGLGFSLHAPSNGWFFGSTGMVNQFSQNFGYGAPGYVDLWSGFVNDWYDSSNIFCLDKQKLIKTEIELESIDINPRGQTGAMIRISDHEILVLESRRPSKYSIFPDGFYGITVTKVDTSKLYARFERKVDGFDWEQRQWSYYARVNQQKSPEWIVQSQTPSRVIGYLGEVFEIDGIRITLLKTGKFDTVLIEKI